MMRIDFRRQRLVLVALGCGAVTGLALVALLRSGAAGPSAEARPERDGTAVATDAVSESGVRLRSAREVARQSATSSAGGGLAFIDATFGFSISTAASCCATGRPSCQIRTGWFASEIPSWASMVPSLEPSATRKGRCPSVRVRSPA